MACTLASNSSMPPARKPTAQDDLVALTDKQKA